MKGYLALCVLTALGLTTLVGRSPATRSHDSYNTAGEAYRKTDPPDASHGAAAVPPHVGIPTFHIAGWVLHDLGALTPDRCEAAGISASAQVAGWIRNSRNPGYRAVLFRREAIFDLGTLPGGRSSAARAVNTLDQAVGWAETSDGERRAVLYRDGTPTPLGTLGRTLSDAFDLNDAGQIVGGAFLLDYGWHAFLFDGDRIQDLGTLGGLNSEARGINRCGEVVGWAETADGRAHAFRFRGDKMSDMGTLGGRESIAYDINDAGDVVGRAHSPDGGRAFLYRGDRMRDLGTLGGNDSAAFGINAAGQVVGRSRTADGSYHAFRYVGGSLEDLNAGIDPRSGWVLNAAYAINDAGQIAGEGAFRGRRRAFLLEPDRGRRTRHARGGFGISARN